MLKLYFHRETGNVYQLAAGELWAHPIYEGDQLLDTDVDADMEWTCVDGFGDPVMHEGREINQLEFIPLIKAKLK